MKAVILNSGTGSRMGPITDDKPKCLVPLGDNETILSRQVRQLLAAGIEDILITIGPFGTMIPDYLAKEFPAARIVCVVNDVYDKTNYIFSMHLADHLLREDLLLLHGDLVFDDKLLADFLASPDSDTVLIDRQAVLPPKDFKCFEEDSVIREIRVDLEAKPGVSFLLPLYKLSQAFMEAWMDEITAFVSAGNTGVYAENAFNSIAHTLKLKGYDKQGRLCMEVDTLEDLLRAMDLLYA